MGGAASAVSDDTQSIVLEAAWFAPEIIAGKSRQYGFGSDSSFRFERGVDYRLQADAIERASELVLQICGGAAGEMVEALGRLPENKQVELRLGRLKIHGANGQFLPVCICFYDGQTCFFLPNTLTLLSDGLRLSEINKKAIKHGFI